MGSTEDDMCHSSGMNTNLLFEKVAEMGMSSNGANPFFNSCWDPLSQTQFANPAYPIPLENQAISSFSHPVHYQSDSGLCKMVPKLPCFGSGGLSEMVNSFGPSEFGCPPNYPQNKEGTSEEEEDSYSGKKKGRDSYSNSPFNPIKNAEGEKEKEPSEDSSGFQKEQQDKKKRRMEQNIAKQAKGNSDSREAPKENYIHMRAKRGQATNSHSLAERVRREKISERMKILQELVPGCNKITGKAVMLDEIINYVQSLQQQVEFLSMKLATVNPKLATVNPELNTDMEQILSKDILHLRGSNAAILGFGPGLSSSNPYTQGITQGSLSGIPSTTPPFYHLPQTLWDNELQSLFQMGFDSNPTNNNSVPNGSSKLEL